MRKSGLFLLCLFALILGAAFYLREKQTAKAGPYEQVAERLNAALGVEACDRQDSQRKVKLSRLLDQLRPRILKLWEKREAKEFPKEHLEAVGPVFLRISPAQVPDQAFDISSWSWEDAEATVIRTQSDPAAPETKERWRDFDTILRFLLEKDVGRLLQGKAYLPPAQTQQEFRVRPGVVRTASGELSVTLDAGDFKGAEKPLAALMEKTWSIPGHRLRVLWGKGGYRLRGNFHSSRSYVDHRAGILAIANYAWSRTVAHELGHVLGFDDHYYSVWHGGHCYYSQESRLQDLMSNSEHGLVLPDHWKILDRAYPLEDERQKEREKVFSYLFPPPKEGRATAP